jgi:hypothetical protein
MVVRPPCRQQGVSRTSVDRYCHWRKRRCREQSGIGGHGQACERKVSVALGISEANAVNVVLRALYGPSERDPLPAPGQQAVDEAAAVLAEKAHRALGAGITAADIRAKAAARS